MFCCLELGESLIVQLVYKGGFNASRWSLGHTCWDDPINGICLGEWKSIAFVTGKIDHPFGYFESVLIQMTLETGFLLSGFLSLNTSAISNPLPSFFSTF